MLMVIFGAGASFDSSPTYTEGMKPPGADENDAHNAYYRPPLAKELFANRPLFIEAIDYFPDCKTVVPRLRAPAALSGEISIEGLLQKIESEASTYPRGRQELASVQCYIQRAISECQIRWRRVTRGITNYLTLLREIERTHKGAEPVCLVTFNYDTLLEDALEALGHRIARMQDYADRKTLFRVFKLHGSVNWAQIVENNLPVNVSLQHPRSVLDYLIQTPELRFSSEFVLCDPASMGVADGRPAFPAIAIPVEKKDRFACPQNHLDRLTELLPTVSKVIVIGWRATEAHFLSLLITRLRPGIRLHVVAGSGNDALESRARVCEALDSPVDLFESGEGFTDFTRSNKAVDFLLR